MTKDHDDNYTPVDAPRRIPHKFISIAIVLTLGCISICYLPDKKDAI